MRALVALLVLVLTGCPPPLYVDIHNNTGELVEIVSKKATWRLPAGTNLKIEGTDLFQYWAKSERDGLGWPYLCVRIGAMELEYRFAFVRGSEFVPSPGPWINVVQIEKSGRILAVKFGADRPVPADSPQPEQFPLEPSRNCDPKRAN